MEELDRRSVMEAHPESNNTEVPVIDRGCASHSTKGTTFGIYWEGGFAPFNRYGP
jgi:hypothetical protein